MVHFNFYLRAKLEENGYGTVKHDSENDLFMRVENGPDQGKLIWACYLDKPIEPEQIRRFLEFKGYVLFVVKESLIPGEIKSRDETPMWLRVLHGLYMGRVYVWNGRYLFGLHFDYDTGDISESSIIQPDNLLLVESGTWLRGWTDQYRLARFYDRQWWGDSQPRSGYANGRDNYQDQADASRKAWEDFYRNQPPYTNYNTGEQQSSSQQSARQAYEQARDRYQQQQQQRERAQRQQYDSDGFAYDPNDWPGGKPPKPPPKHDFMTQFARAGSPSAVKALYRELAKKYHPDLNPGVDTTAIMQQVNAAYDRYK